MKNHLLVNYFFIISLVLLFACNRNSKEEQISKITTNTIEAIEYDNDTTTENLNNEIYVENNIISERNIRIANKTRKIYKSLTYENYEIPAPFEVFFVLKQQEPYFELLNSISEAETVHTSFEKSFNIGMSFTDMSYCFVFENNQEFINYYQKIKSLSQDLGIETGFEHDFIKNFNEPSLQTDSSKNIVNKALFITCQYLEKNNNLNILPFVVVGGWLESTYLLTNTAVNNETNDALLIKEIIKQKIVMINLIKFINDVTIEISSYETNSYIHKILQDIESILQLFNKLGINKDSFISADNLNLLNQQITEIRNKYIYE